MHLETILELPAFHLPAENVGTKPYVLFAEERLTEYANLVKTSAADFFLNCAPQILGFNEYAKHVDLLAKGLIEVIRLNKAGDVNAFKRFDKLMKNIGMFMTNFEGAIAFIKPDDHLYRCKFDKDAGPLKGQNFFFHTPFELNHLVTGTRFAGPGCPAVYLANSVIGGYVETRASALKGFQGVRFKTKMPLSFLNLDYNMPSLELKHHKPADYDLQLQLKGLLYPLLFCCYSQQNTSSAIAAQEYLIPQFLLKWVQKNNKFISGIRYPSTRIDNPHFDGVFYNLVLPPIKREDVGICPELRALFQMSDVVGAELHKIDIDRLYATTFPVAGSVNPAIISIEWKGLLEGYNTSEIGKMEFFLKSNPVFDIAF
jgi:hypothetical protein